MEPAFKVSGTHKYRQCVELKKKHLNESETTSLNRTQILNISVPLELE